MSKMPAELEGKTPEEIVAHYQAQMHNQKSHYEAALEALGDGGSGGGNPPPGNTPPQPPPKKTPTEFMMAPEDSVREIMAKEGVSRAEFVALASSQQQNLIWIAKQRAMDDLRKEAAKRGGSFDWDRVETMLDDIAKKCDPHSLTQSETWKTNYYYNRGLIADSLVKEGVTRAITPMGEGSTPGGSPPPKDEPITMEEAEVAVGLGLTSESYKQAKKDMKENKFPLTYDNRNRR